MRSGSAGKTMWRLCVWVVGLAAPVVVARGQAEGPWQRGEGSLLLGPGGFGLGVAYARETPGRAWRIRGVIADNGGGTYSSAPGITVYELAAMVGRGGGCCTGTRRNWGYVTGGLSIVSVDRTVAASTRSTNTVGIAGEAGLVSGRLPHVVASVQANVNPERSWVLLGLGIAVGRLPNH